MVYRYGEGKEICKKYNKFGLRWLGRHMMIEYLDMIVNTKFLPDEHSLSMNVAAYGAELFKKYTEKKQLKQIPIHYHWSYDSMNPSLWF